MKIVVFSDSHSCGKPSSWASLFDKRVIGLFNFHYRRQHQHNQKWLYRMVDYILNDPPDVVICTGDISTSGEPSEFKEASEILEPLIKDSRIKFFYVPGNHDYYVKNPICFNALKDIFYYLNKGRYRFDDLPFSISVEGVDFCFVNECYPVNLLISTGKMKAETASYINRWIEDGSKRPKVLVGHYPLLEEHSILRFRHKLYGQNMIRDKLEDKKLDLSLCGHVHTPHIDIDESGRGEIIIGSVTRNACGAKIEYDYKKNIFSYEKIDLINY